MPEIIPFMENDVACDPLCEVLARFSESEDRIRELFMADEQFRELCTDYGECLATLRRFRKQGSGMEERIEQHTELLASLGQELVVRLSGTSDETENRPMKSQDP